MIARGESAEQAREAIHYVAPVGEKEMYVERAIAVIAPFMGSGPFTGASTGGVTGKRISAVSIG